jgi:uncharacterized protein (TIGR00725 family)
VTPRPAVAVVGPWRTTDDALLEAAAQVGAGLARAGQVVVTGGLDGVMAAASRGARQAGGLVVGILPGPDAAAANDWVDIALPTSMDEGRNALVVRAAAVVVAVGGSWGTLAEVALARRLGRPVVSLHGWSVDGPDAADGPVVVGSPDEAVRAAVSLLSASPS